LRAAQAAVLFNRTVTGAAGVAKAKHGGGGGATRPGISPADRRGGCALRNELLLSLQMLDARVIGMGLNRTESFNGTNYFVFCTPLEF
jgi:hypothetical protein